MTYDGLSREFRFAKLLHAPKSEFVIKRVNKLLERSLNKLKSDDTIEILTYVLEGYEQIPFEVKVLLPRNVQHPLPCIVYYHGGGFYLKVSANHINLLKTYAIECQVAVVMVDYKLSIDYPFPGGFTDCYKVLQWLVVQKDLEWVDRNRIAVAGDSAGGALAAVVAQKAREEGLTNLTFQMLLYPVIDSSQTSETLSTYEDAPVWNRANNEYMWQLYLSGSTQSASYDAPLSCKDLSGLTKAYIETAEFDCLSGEGQAYVKGLEKAGVEVEHYHVKGAVHGYDMFPTSQLAKDYIKKRCTYINASFGE